MKTLSIVLATLLLTIGAAQAVMPTGTVWRVVFTDTNSVLVGEATNLVTRNGIATTGSVAAVAQSAAAGMATGTAAQVTASAAMATGVQAQASADAAMQTGVTSQATASAALQTGSTAQATAEAAMATGMAARVVADAAWRDQSYVTQFTYSVMADGVNITGYNGGSDLVIPESIAGLDVVAVGYGSDTFYGAGGITNLSLPRTIKRFGVTTFGGRIDLRTVSIADGVSVIGDGLFNGCTSLTSITLPASIIFVDYAAFSSCDALTNVTFQGDAPALGEGVFTSSTNVIVYAANSRSTGWGESGTFGGQTLIKSSRGYINDVSLTLHGSGDGAVDFVDWSGLGQSSAGMSYDPSAGKIFFASFINSWCDGAGNTFFNSDSRIFYKTNGDTAVDLSDGVQIDEIQGGAWHTNQVLAIDGTTNTIIYFGLP